MGAVPSRRKALYVTPMGEALLTASSPSGRTSPRVVRVQPSREKQVRAVEVATLRHDLLSGLARGDTAAVERVLGTDGWDPDVVDAPCESAPSNLGTEGDSPLMLACRWRNQAMVELLLRASGINVNRQNEVESRDSALTIACADGQAGLVQQILATSRADVNLARNDGCTALFMASQNGHTAVVKLLLATPGIKVDMPDAINSFTPLMIAAFRGRNPVVKELLLANASTSVETPKGYNALLIAVDRNDPVLHAALLMHGADAGKMHSKLFCSGLNGAAWAAREALMALGPSLASDDASLSPLHISCILGMADDVRRQLRPCTMGGSEMSAALASAADASGLSPLYYAVELGEQPIVQTLLDALSVPNGAASKSLELMNMHTPVASPCAGRLGCARDGSTFFHSIVMPFFEDRIYVKSSGVKTLLVTYLGSVAAAKFFAKDDSAFRRLHAVSVRNLRIIQQRLEHVFQEQQLGNCLSGLGDDISERAGGVRQDDEGLLPLFPDMNGYGPTAVFYEDDYIDALHMISTALDDAFFRRVSDALQSVDCQLRHPPIKSRTRMRNKLGDPEDHAAKARPRPAHNLDTMRCAITFSDPKRLARGYKALVSAFGKPVRVKNSFDFSFDPSKSYGYRSVMMNMRFDTGVTFEEVFGSSGDKEGYRLSATSATLWDEIARSQRSQNEVLAMKRILGQWLRHEAIAPLNISIAAEVQLILSPYLQARKESHLLYKVARCSAVEALVRDAATAGSLSRTSTTAFNSLEMLVTRMKDRTSQLILLRGPKSQETLNTVELEDLDDSLVDLDEGKEIDELHKMFDSMTTRSEL